MGDLVTARDHAVPSDTLGRYRLLGVLGRGSRGIFHLGVAKSLGTFKKLVVVKELRAELASDARSVEAFLGEAKLAARLSHPNIVQAIEADADGGRPFLAIEFLDGQTFAEAWRRNVESGGLSLAAQVRILCEALSGLHHAHELCDYDGRELHVVHGDVRPEYLFVTYDGQVKLMNFRGARPPRESGPTAEFDGRLAYAAPEQVRGRPWDRRTDVFAVGVLLWEVLAGQRFTTDPDNPAAIKARLFGLEPRISQAAPNAPHGLANICNRALAVDPSDRFSTAEDFKDALLAFLRASGDAVEPRIIGTQMRSLFEPERAAMHRIIEAALTADEPPDSNPLAPPDAVTPVQRDAATVASLPPLTSAVESDEEELVEEVPNFRSRRPAFVAAIVATALAAVGGFWFGMEPDATASRGGAASVSPVVPLPSTVPSVVPPVVAPPVAESAAAEAPAVAEPAAVQATEPASAAPTAPTATETVTTPPAPSAWTKPVRSKLRAPKDEEPQPASAPSSRQPEPLPSSRQVSPGNPYEE